MNITGKTIIGSIFMLIGISIVFDGSLGGLIPSAIGAWLIYVGVKKYDKASKTIGVIMAVSGILLVVHSLPFLIGIACASAMLYFGWEMLDGESAKGPSSRSYPEPETSPQIEEPIQTSFDQEWEDFLKKK
ncbi:hypothetical protein [Bacillus sp. NPDC093026]|uniref:hypothetical protein n=1 Tax=Bacillus sp. NPDC093026 TaxID=3363948 RepID=UPI0037FE82CA